MPLLGTQTPTCRLCGRQQPTQATCSQCSDRLHHNLTNIPQQTHQAHTWQPTPHHTHRPTPASRPPLPLTTIDPELTLIETTPGNPHTATPLLTILETWERHIRTHRNLTPYGPASRHRNHDTSTHTALTTTVAFLTTQLEWMHATPEFPLPAFNQHIRQAAQALNRYSDDTHHGTRITCPTTFEDGTTCDQTLRIDNTGDAAYCRRCCRTWTIEWLIKVAAESADGWADAEAVARLSGLHETTIRRWARAKKIRQRGLLYSVRDVADRVNSETAACP